MTLSGGAELKNADIYNYIDGINSKGGKAELIIKNVEKAGKYRVTLTYSNNDEGGVHDYNVDLIERYVTVSVNGRKAGNIYCRNTYSWQSRNTVTFTVDLKEGNNNISFTNDGSENFNSNETSAPYIFAVSVNPANK